MLSFGKPFLYFSYEPLVDHIDDIAKESFIFEQGE